MPPGVSVLQCPVCNREFDPSTDGAERQFNIHVNKCVDGLWSEDSNSRSSSQQPAAPSPPNQTATNPNEAELVAMLIQIMPDLTSVQARELLAAYNYQLEILVPMLLELQEEPQRTVSAPRGVPSQRPSARTPPLEPVKKPVAEPATSLVELVIYDLQPERSFAKTIGLGAFHSAVIVYGVEISFGGTLDPKANKDVPGVWSTRRKYTAAPAVKARLALGETQWTLSELKSALHEMGTTEWRVRDYHLLAKNCNHFTDALLRKLGQRASKLSEQQFRDMAQRDAMKRSPQIPELTLPEDYLDEKKKPTAVDVFKLPAWVNRAAKLGDKVVPDFIFTKILEKLMPPVAEDQQDDEPSTPAAASSSSAVTAQAGPSGPARSSPVPAAPEPQTATGGESSAETQVLNSICEIIGADATNPVVRLHALGVLRSCRGNADLAVQKLLQ